MGNRVIFLPLVEADGKLPTKAHNGEAYHNAEGALFMKLENGTVVNCVEAALKQFGSKLGSDKPLEFGDAGEARIHYDSAGSAFAFMNMTNGGNVAIKTKKTNGSEARILYASGDGVTRLYHPATDKEVMRSRADGISLYDPADTAHALSTTFNATHAFVSASRKLAIRSNDEVAIQTNVDSAAKTATFLPNGDLRVSGGIVAHFSDERLKTGFKPIGAAMHKVSQLEGVFYSPNEKAVELGFDSLDTQLVGLKAQQVLQVLPEAVTDIGIESGEGEGDMFLTVQYEKLVPLLVEAIKELSAKIEVLESK
jgi:hypothetical protein